MPLADTARMLAVLDLKDGLTPVVRTMGKSLDRLDSRISKTQSRSFRAGQQIGTGIKAGVTIAAGALTGLAGLLLVSAKEGQEAQKVQQVYAAAIANSGKVSADYVTRLNAQQDALLNLTGTDDEVIKQQQTRLIQMGLTGAQVEKLTPLIFDLAASGKDLEASTTAVGKAAQGSNTALQRMGIIVPKGADAIAILNQRFKGTAAAVSGGLDVRLRVLNERMANLREAAGIKLLPSLTKLVDIVSARLVPAFGQLLDTIMPSAIAALERLSSFLEGGGATSAITKMLDIAKSAAPVLKGAAEATLTIVQTAVGLFSSLPPEIQSLAVAGLALNKLTGGLVTNIAGGLISAVISSFKGLMNVNAAVVNVNGPVAGGPSNLAGSLGVGALGGLAAIAAAVATTLISSAQYAGSHIAPLQAQGLTRAEILAQQYYTADAATQQQILKHVGSQPTLADFQSGNIKLSLANPANPSSPINIGQDAAEKAQQARMAAFSSVPTRADLRHRIAQAEAALKGAKGKDIDRLRRDIGVDQRRLAKRIADAAKRAQDQASALTTAVRGVSDTIQSNKPVVNLTVPVATYINGRLIESNLNRYQTVVGGQQPFSGQLGGA